MNATFDEHTASSRLRDPCENGGWCAESQCTGGRGDEQRHRSIEARLEIQHAEHRRDDHEQDIGDENHRDEYTLESLSKELCGRLGCLCLFDQLHHPIE